MWTKVSEGLPKKNCYCFVAAPSGYVSLTTFKNGRFLTNREVIAWSMIDVNKMTGLSEETPEENERCVALVTYMGGYNWQQRMVKVCEIVRYEEDSYRETGRPMAYLNSYDIKGWAYAPEYRFA